MCLVSPFGRTEGPVVVAPAVPVLDAVVAPEVAEVHAVGVGLLT